LRGNISEIVLRLIKEFVRTNRWSFREPDNPKNETYIKKKGFTRKFLVEDVVLNLKEDEFVKKERAHKNTGDVYIFKKIYDGGWIYVKVEILDDFLHMTIWSIHEEDL